MILYKYLPPTRVEVLKKRLIRFTQPTDFNDPFEFRPAMTSLLSNKHIDTFMAEDFDRMVDEELIKYGALVPAVAKEIFPEFIAAQKARFPEIIRSMEPAALAAIQPMIWGVLNRNVGLLCLSEIKDSLLMWGHYAHNHTGFVVGFDSEDPFFDTRRSDKAEFGYLIKVTYSPTRPNVTLSNSGSLEWFETKSQDWAYEKEWRLLRVLREAASVIDRQPFPIHLFEFPSSAVREIILGMRSAEETREALRSISAEFPHTKLFQARDHPHHYSLLIEAA